MLPKIGWRNRRPIVGGYFEGGGVRTRMRGETLGGMGVGGGVSFSLCLYSAVCGREFVGEMLVKCAVQGDLSEESVNYWTNNYS